MHIAQTLVASNLGKNAESIIDVISCFSSDGRMDFAAQKYALLVQQALAVSIWKHTLFDMSEKDISKVWPNWQQGLQETKPNPLYIFSPQDILPHLPYVDKPSRDSKNLSRDLSLCPCCGEAPLEKNICSATGTIIISCSTCGANTTYEPREGLIIPSGKFYFLLLASALANLIVEAEPKYLSKEICALFKKEPLEIIGFTRLIVTKALYARLAFSGSVDVFYLENSIPETYRKAIGLETEEIPRKPIEHHFLDHVLGAIGIRKTCEEK